MRFGPLPLQEARDEILAHNISDEEGRRVLRKGRTLDDDALRTLEELGHEQVYVARLDPDDVHEDEAAERIAGMVHGSGTRAGRPHTGRVNLIAATTGVLRVDLEGLRRLNAVPGVTVATLPRHSLVHPDERVATVKIIPYALPGAALADIETGSAAESVIRVDEISPADVAIVLVGGEGAWTKMADGVGAAIRRRIETFGCRAAEPTFVPLDEERLAGALAERMREHPALVVIAGETAIMDVDDLIPRGLRRAGGRVEDLGLAMDPGQLLLLGYLRDTPVVGAPGCVRGTAPDGFDAVVPRLLAGEHLTREDLHALAHGGLLSNPRSR